MTVLLESERPTKALPAAVPHPSRPSAACPNAAHSGEYLSFRISDEEYALGILNEQLLGSHSVGLLEAGDAH
ncbi:MAG: hypothetical protein JF606_20110 [Burkholderiales bacterium]|nr:hypothetical protein [Burkholderiales bacterium]